MSTKGIRDRRNKSRARSGDVSGDLERRAEDVLHRLSDHSPADLTISTSNNLILRRCNAGRLSPETPRALQVTLPSYNSGSPEMRHSKNSAGMLNGFHAIAARSTQCDIPTEPTPPFSPGTPLGADVSPSKTKEPLARFLRASLNRYQGLIERERRATSDEERLRLYAEFIVKETILRQERFLDAFAVVGDDLRRTTASLWAGIPAGDGTTTMTTTSELDGYVDVQRLRDSLLAIEKTPTTATYKRIEHPAATAVIEPTQATPTATEPTQTAPGPLAQPETQFDDPDLRGRPASRWWESSTPVGSVRGSVRGSVSGSMRGSVSGSVRHKSEHGSRGSKGKRPVCDEHEMPASVKLQAIFDIQESPANDHPMQLVDVQEPPAVDRATRLVDEQESPAIDRITKLVADDLCLISFSPAGPVPPAPWEESITSVAIASAMNKDSKTIDPATKSVADGIDLLTFSSTDPAPPRPWAKSTIRVVNSPTLIKDCPEPSRPVAFAYMVQQSSSSNETMTSSSPQCVSQTKLTESFPELLEAVAVPEPCLSNTIMNSATNIAYEATRETLDILEDKRQADDSLISLKQDAAALEGKNPFPTQDKHGMATDRVI